MVAMVLMLSVSNHHKSVHKKSPTGCAPLYPNLRPAKPMPWVHGSFINSRIKTRRAPRTRRSNLGNTWLVVIGLKGPNSMEMKIQDVTFVFPPLPFRIFRCTKLRTISLKSELCKKLNWHILVYQFSYLHYLRFCFLLLLLLSFRLKSQKKHCGFACWSLKIHLLGWLSVRRIQWYYLKYDSNFKHIQISLYFNVLFIDYTPVCMQHLRHSTNGASTYDGAPPRSHPSCVHSYA